jgi:hypothetical protein
MNYRMRDLAVEELGHIAGGLNGMGFVSLAATISQRCQQVPVTTVVAGAVFYQANQTTTVCTIDDGDDE